MLRMLSISVFVVTLIKLCVIIIPSFGMMCQALQSPMDFLCGMLNVTLTQLEDITNNFHFHYNISTSDIKFLLYTKSMGAIEINAELIREVDLSFPTKIVVHGWQSSAVDNADMMKIAKNYHKRGKYNVILVDWSKYSKTSNYPYAAGRTMGVGELVGDFILKMIGDNSLRNIHLIGHSLGAHVMGFAGKRVMKEGTKVGRITGLDPAAPLFEYPLKLPQEFRLSQGDADFVDIIHTNAGLFGVRQRYGNADFYVERGGPIQPQCLIVLDVIEIAACSHYKSVEYFMESIAGSKFKAISCPGLSLLESFACDGNKTALMGEDAEKGLNGIFQLNVVLD